VTQLEQVGGPDRKITLYSRENNSGTYVYFKARCSWGRTSSPARNICRGAGGGERPFEGPWAIGYGRVRVRKGIREISIRKDASSPAYPREREHRHGQVPISRYLFMYTRTRPVRRVKKYIGLDPRNEGRRSSKRWGIFRIREIK